VKLIVAFEGSLNCTPTVADSPGARLAMPGTVRYGVPESALVAFASVTPDLRPMKSICKGPLMLPPRIFLMVTVPLKVLVTRL